MFPGQLLIADYRAGRAYAVEAGTLREIGPGVLAEHAGFLTLPAGAPAKARWAYVEDRAGALVVGGPDGERRIPVAIPGEHLAGDAGGRHIVITTGLGASHEPWSDVVTVVDLARDEAVRFRVRTGEPGAGIVTDRSNGEPVVVLRHREPGAIEAIPLTRAVAAGAHLPVLRGAVTTDIAPDGHGDVVDQRGGVVATATSRGIERFVVDDGRPRAIGILPWPVPGRAYYLRFDPATGRAVGVVRGGPAAPESWTEWTNTLVDIDLATGDTRCAGLGPGLAFRFALGGGSAAVATIHPDGDAVTLVDRGGPAPHTAWRTALPPMSRPPAPGRLPWDPVGDAPAQRRAVALDPAGATVAVTRGGDAELHVVREDALETIAVPSPLAEGGHLLWLATDPAPETDSVGR
ncbi:hypothetical protein [Jiangella endophytica]|uniref:hypothetical protein n=1 Tax=Jiangella endophytica TaxID=1623398 RepID=UPI000E343470|nr:hypothetical protein [Jiangella endophytica]